MAHMSTTSRVSLIWAYLFNPNMFGLLFKSLFITIMIEDTWGFQIFFYWK